MVADSVARRAPGQAAEFLAKFAGELARQSGAEFSELRVIALLHLCHVQQTLQRSGDAERTRQEALALFDGIGEPGTKLNIEDRLAEALIQFAEYRRASWPRGQTVTVSDR